MAVMDGSDVMKSSGYQSPQSTPPPLSRILWQVSTLAMVIADKTYRPGVSISLSCHMFHPVAPGER